MNTNIIWRKNEDLDARKNSIIKKIIIYQSIAQNLCVQIYYERDKFIKLENVEEANISENTEVIREK